VHSVSVGSKWIVDLYKLRILSHMVLCFLTTEFGKMWKNSKQAIKVDAAINETSRILTGCLKHTKRKMYECLVV